MNNQTREIEHNYIAGKFAEAFKSTVHESICSTYMFMFIQVLDNGGGVE
jgi:hypothetical protein